MIIELALFLLHIAAMSGFGGLRVACWTLVPKFAGFKGEKILTTPSFGGKVKPSFPCRRCKRTLKVVEVVISAKLPVNILAHSSHFRRWHLSRRGGRGGT